MLLGSSAISRQELFTLPGEKSEGSPQSPSRRWIYGISTAGVIDTFDRVTNALMGIQYLARTVTALARTLLPLVALPKLAQITGSIDSAIASIRIFNDIRYLSGPLLEKDIETGAWFSMGCNGLFTFSDGAATLAYLHDFNILNVTELAASIGSFSVFGLQPLKLIAQMSMAPFMVYTALGGYIFMGLDSIQKRRHGDTSAETAVFLARSIAEVALKTFLMTSRPFLFTIHGQVIWGILGTVAAGLAVVSIYLSST